MSKSSSYSGGISTISALTIVFIVLKLTDVIDWSWFWVLSPTIFSTIIIILILLIVLIISMRN